MNDTFALANLDPAEPAGTVSHGTAALAAGAEPPRIDELRLALLTYYDLAARTLPWRGEIDPYRILVSEVMLQQTRVDTAVRYYERWLVRFPDLGTLASATEDEVLKAWEGLGYYRRARNLHGAVRAVREASGGVLPRGVAELRALPGVGEYTAGAVASIAFGVVTPAVDGNARRVLARLFDQAAPSPSWLRTTAAALVDPRRPGDWNQALMELGATVCTARGPTCARCPLALFCVAKARGTQLVRPDRKPRRPAPRVHYVLGVFHTGGRVLLRRRAPEGLLASMWAFPEISFAAAPTTADGCAAASTLAESSGLAMVGEPEPLAPVEHAFTHLRAVYVPWAVEVRRVEGATDLDRVWLDPVEGEIDVALPVAQRRVLDAWLARDTVRERRAP